MRLLSVLLLVLALSGCATVTVSTDGGRSLAAVENNCWYLLGFVPLGSGDVDAPNEDCCCFLEDTVTLKNNLKLLDYAVERKHASGYERPHSYFRRESYCLFLLLRRTCYTTAELTGVPGL